MKTRTRLVYLCVMPLFIAAYIVGMATAKAKPHDNEGPKEYASPNGNAWGFQHGKGQPEKP